MTIHEDDKPWVLLFWAVGIYSVYYLVPFDEHAPEYSLFPFSKQKITYATYAHYACGYLRFVICILTMQWLAKKECETSFKILFWFEMIGIGNFVLRYGDSFIKEHEWFDMMTIRLPVWGFVCIRQIVLNYRNRRKLKYGAS